MAKKKTKIHWNGLGHQLERIREIRISEILPQEVASDLPSIADIESAVSMGIQPTTD